MQPISGKADRGIQGLSTGGALLPTDSLDDNYEEDQDDGEEEHCRGAVLVSGPASSASMCFLRDEMSFGTPGSI